MEADRVILQPEDGRETGQLRRRLMAHPTYCLTVDQERSEAGQIVSVAATDMMQVAHVPISCRFGPCVGIFHFSQNASAPQRGIAVGYIMVEVCCDFLAHVAVPVYPASMKVL